MNENAGQLAKERKSLALYAWSSQLLLLVLRKLDFQNKKDTNYRAG